MATITPTQYGNYIIFINKHLFIDNPRNITDKLLKIYTAKRNAPIFLCHEMETKNKLMQIFQLKEKIFTDHFMNFPSHTVKITTLGAQPTEELHLATELPPSHDESQSLIDTRTLWGYGFYHFMTEVLPAILEINRPYPILLNRSSFAEPILRWFGVNNKLIYEMPIQKPTYIYRMPMIECGLPSPRKFDLQKAAIESRDCIPDDISGGAVGILIYREERLRNLLNATEVFALLKRTFPDIEWHIFNRLPIAEAASLFSKAKYVFAPHGAGLSNTVFCPKGAAVIELLDLNNPNTCYWHTSEMLQNRHFMIPEPTVNTQFSPNIEQLEKHLIKIKSILTASSEQNP
jgi:hypothetical protein